MQAEILLDITNRLSDNEESNIDNTRITPDSMQVGVFPDTTGEINRLSNNDEESDINENMMDYILKIGMRLKLLLIYTRNERNLLL